MKVWEQIEPFCARKMGSKSGWALANVRQGFNIPTGRYQSCKADIEAQLKAKTAHSFRTLPQGVSVPVYAIARLKKICTVHRLNGYAFVITSKGKIYADGHLKSRKWLEYVASNNHLYWGEFCDGVRVVKEMR